MGALTDRIEQALFEHIVLDAPWTEIRYIRLGFADSLPHSVESSVLPPFAYLSEPVTFVCISGKQYSLDSTLDIRVEAANSGILSTLVIVGDVVEDGVGGEVLIERIPMFYHVLPYPIDTRSMQAFIIRPGDVVIDVPGHVSQRLGQGIFDVLFDGAAELGTLTRGNVHAALTINAPVLLGNGGIESFVQSASFTSVAQYIHGCGRNSTPLIFPEFTDVTTARALTHAAFLDGNVQGESKLLAYAPLDRPAMLHNGLNILFPSGTLRLEFI